MSLIPLVLTLRIIPTGNQLGHILPVRRIEAPRFDTALDAVRMNGPVEQLGLILIPVALSCVLPILTQND